MNEELSYDQKKAWAKTLYTKEEAAVPDIALIVGADEVIVSLWIEDGRWHEIKRSLLISKKMQLQILYNTLELVTNRLSQETDLAKIIKDVDLIGKYTAAIKNLESETGVPYIVQVAELFTTWLLRRDPELSRKVTPYFDAFIRERDITRAKNIR